MATTGNVKTQIAGIGHVYVAAPGTEVPSLDTYKFGDGTTLTGYTWLGDTSGENIPEFSTDGGDATTVDSWDRKALRATRNSKTHTVTINSINLGEDTFKVAFPGSEYDSEAKAWDLNLDGSTERAILIVVEEGTTVSAMLLRRVDLSGSMPTMDKENFTEIAISGTLLSPTDGKTKVRYFEPRTVTG